MKKLLVLFSIVMITAVITSCKKDEQSVENTFSVSPESIGIQKSLTGASVNVTCSGYWFASVSGSWGTISPEQGFGNGSISFKTTSNSTGAKRYCTITITSGEVTKTVSVTQAYY